MLDNTPETHEQAVPEQKQLDKGDFELVMSAIVDLGPLDEDIRVAAIQALEELEGKYEGLYLVDHSAEDHPWIPVLSSKNWLRSEVLATKSTKRRVSSFLRKIGGSQNSDQIVKNEAVLRSRIAIVREILQDYDEVLAAFDKLPDEK